MESQKIIPNLWFDPEKYSAEAAAEFYNKVFNNLSIETIARYEKV
ncbi:VOC family protein [Salegentibacter sp. HM20]